MRAFDFAPELLSQTGPSLSSRTFVGRHQRNLKIPYLLLALVVGLAACSKCANLSLARDTDYWTCGMHPSVKAKAPGKCPICGMDLIHVERQKGERKPSQSSSTPDRSAQPGSIEQYRLSEFTIPLDRQQRIGVTYGEVRRRPMRREIRSVGTFEAVRSLNFECVSRVDGYIEKLHVTSPGELVDVGQPLATIYTPDLRAPEQEFVNLLRVRESGSGPPDSMDQLIESARRRLRFLSVSQNEIEELERTRQPTDQLLLRSPFKGVVDQLPAKLGMSVKQGDRIMTVIDSSSLWLWGNVYEGEVGLVKEGQSVSVAVPAFPNQTFEGKISSMDPTIDPSKRTAKVRIDISNLDGELRPGMYATAIVKIEAGEGLSVPFNAVLPTGSRMLVFVDKDSGRLEPRFVEVGREFFDPTDQKQERYYEIVSGLQEGERIVSAANFLVDAEAQIQGAIKDWSQPAESSGEMPSEQRLPTANGQRSPPLPSQ